MTVTITGTDDDTPGLVVAPRVLTVMEPPPATNADAPYAVRLVTAPAGNVVVTIEYPVVATVGAGRESGEPDADVRPEYVEHAASDDGTARQQFREYQHDTDAYGERVGLGDDRGERPGGYGGYDMGHQGQSARAGYLGRWAGRHVHGRDAHAAELHADGERDQHEQRGQCGADRVNVRREQLRDAADGNGGDRQRHTQGSAASQYTMTLGTISPLVFPMSVTEIEDTTPTLAAVPNQTYQAGNVRLVAVGGNAPLRYTLTGPSPVTDLTFDPATRRIQGMLEAAAAEATPTPTVMDANPDTARGRSCWRWKITRCRASAGRNCWCGIR